MPVAQVALHFGANDVQGTIVREEIFRAAGSTTGTEQKLEELVRGTRPGAPGSGSPVQRDTLYNELPHGGGSARPAIPVANRYRHVTGSLDGIRGGSPETDSGGGRPSARRTRLATAAVIRLGRISYVNMAPVFYRVEAEYEEVSGVPTELNRRLIAGEIDVGADLVDRVRPPRRHAAAAAAALRLVARARSTRSSSSRGSRSTQIRSVAVTPESATSVVLTKVLLPERRRTCRSARRPTRSS